MINIQDKKIPVLFLCRSGIRSLEAAQFASSIGYTDCYNILDGFQGTIKGAGWQKNNLPWKSL
jgi:rhodanese-related sulfurtransferase